MRARKSLVGISGAVALLAAGTLALGWATTASAVTVKAINAATTTSSAVDLTTFFFPVLANIAGNSACVSANTYPTTLTKLDPASASSAFYFDITPTKTLASINNSVAPTNSDDISIRAEVKNNSAGIALISGDGAAYYNTTDSTRIAYGLTEGATKRVGISLKNVTVSATTKDGYCTTLDAEGGGNPDCQEAAGTTLTTLNIVIGLVRSVSDMNSASDDDSTEVKITLANCPPGTTSNTVAYPTLAFTLTPGDERVKVKNESTAPTDPTLLKSVVVFADRSGSSPGVSAEVAREFIGSLGSAEYNIDGLSNEQTYCFSIGYVSNAGFISTVPNPLTASRQCATPSQIDGFLNRSTCFVATAAYGTDLDPRLDALRAFRDRVLLNHASGRAFVKWYYSWSPQAAHWLWYRPAARAAVRAALIPVLGLAHAALWALAHHAALAAITLILAAAFLFLRRRRRSAVAAMLIATVAMVVFASNARASSEEFPMPQESVPAASAPAATSTGATDQTVSRQTLKDPALVQPYIESLKAGRKLEPKYRKTVNQAAGLSIVTSNSFHVTSDKLQANSFDAVYTPSDKYAIGVDLFYERQVFRHWLAGAIGPVFHLNLIALKGKGVFTRFGSTSDDTIFNFYAVPVTAGLSYRLIVGRFIVPFAQYSLAGIPVMEMRDDGHPTRRAIATGNMTVFGVALNMDWLGRRSAWDQYQSSGILHTYLSLQRESLRTKTGPFAFDYDATYAGLTFEI
ncbi:MAG: hypothetical protein HYW49_00705 [Deltaproteobacteria bacterium]|nr:hypothetical protein [Deltaproteobacteria bacterium]